MIEPGPLGAKRERLSIVLGVPKKFSLDVAEIYRRYFAAKSVDSGEA